MAVYEVSIMELEYANKILNINNVFVDKCTVTEKYFWMAYVNGIFHRQNTGFDTVQEAFDDVLDYLATT